MLKLRKNGQALTADDLDNNFILLFDQIQNLKNIVENKFTNFEQRNASSEFGITIENNKFSLKIPNMEFKGEFDSSKSYKVGDFVFYNHAFWFLKDKCLEPGCWNEQDWYCLFEFSNNHEANVDLEKYKD